jgi:4-hydroxy-2-oxoheptanedioate aldolase
MRSSKILRKIRSGKVARVYCSGSSLVMVPKFAAHFHYDGVWVDSEHRAFDPKEIQAMLANYHTADVDCLFRPSTKEKTTLYRHLEDGATGLMIPHVGSADEARALVQAVKFPPLGDRGIDGAGRDCGFYIGITEDYTDRANRETFLMVQIETPQALENIDEIAAVPGVDLIFLGPGDMSLRQGCTGAARDPKMLENQQKINAACVRHGKAWGRPAGSAEDARFLVEMGARLIAFGSEFMAILQSFTTCSKQLDDILGEESGEPPVPTSKSY